MRIPNNKLLKLFRTPGYCELCGFFVRKREPHHLRAKGMGSGGRLDIRCNLLALGGTEKLPDGRVRFTCHCHKLFHAGKVSFMELVKIAAAREKVSPEAIVEVLDWMRRHVKPTPAQLEKALGELSAEARALAERELGRG